MPASRTSTSDDRASARRRSRQIARGQELPADATEADEPIATGARPPNILARLFPPAPQLPGKGDPLAGFTYTGPARGIVSGAWLLARHPLSWGVAGVGWAILQLALLLVSRENVIAFAITLGQYALLIGAGWFGWWRPWLFGTAAGVFGVLFHAVIAGMVTLQSGESVTAAVAVVGSLSALVILYGLVGAFAGFYGGYLRRRMAVPNANQAKGSNRKRR